MNSTEAIARRPPAKGQLIGVGSDQGDDVAGWMVVDLLRRLMDSQIPQQTSAFQLRRAATPLEMLDSFEVNVPTHIADACIGGQLDVACYRVVATEEDFRLALTVPAGEHCSEYQYLSQLTSQQRVASTHGIDLFAVLSLARELSILPQTLFLWAIRIDDPAVPESPFHTNISSELPDRVQRCVDAIVAWSLAEACQDE